MNRNDAALSMFAQRELEVVASKIYETPYSANRFAEILPVNTSYDPGAQAITWKLLTEYGRAKIVSDYSKDFPVVDGTIGENSNVVIPFGASYQYSDQELRSASLSGVPLQATKAMVARNALMREVDSIAAVGVSDYGLTGLLNNGSAGSTTASTKTAGGLTWAVGTAEENLGDLELMLSELLGDVADSSVELRPNAMIIPPGRIGSLNKRVSDTNMTVLGFFLANHPEFQGNVHVWSHAATAGSGSGTRVVMYRKDPTLVELAMPLPFFQDAPQKQAMAWTVNCLVRTAGVINRYPVAMTYMDGV